MAIVDIIFSNWHKALSLSWERIFCTILHQNEDKNPKIISIFLSTHTRQVIMEKNTYKVLKLAKIAKLVHKWVCLQIHTTRPPYCAWFFYQVLCQTDCICLIELGHRSNLWHSPPFSCSMSLLASMFERFLSAPWTL